MVDIIYSKDGNKFTDIAYPNCIHWLGKLIRVYKFQIGLTNNQDFGVTSKMINYLLVIW